MSDPVHPHASPIRVILVEDNEDDAALLLRTLRRGGYAPAAERVQGAEDLKRALARGPWDLVLSDHSMPQFGSLDALRMVKEADPDLPFIIVSGSIGEEQAVGAMRAGAQDFVMKDQPGRLVPAIERELREADIRRARRNAEEALRVSETRYREMVEELPAVTYIASLDDDHTIFFMSHQIAALLGADLRDPRHLWRDHLYAEDRPRLLAALAESRKRATPFLCEYRLRGAQGRVVWVQDHGVVVSGHRGVQSFMRGFMLDITERRKAEDALNERDRQLRRVQKLEAIGRLAGGVAHDFNNLLTPIVGYGRLLLEDLPGEHASRPLVEEMVRAAERAAKLTRQLLTFSRSRPEEKQRVDLNSAITDMDRFLRRTLGEDVEVVTLLHEAPLVIEADRTNMEQILMNLAVNARDAMPRGGRLVIRTGHCEIDATRAAQQAVRPGPFVTLAVRDNGSGMSPEVREHLFEPFFTTKAEGHGTGLGLSIIYGIVKQSGGYITVETAPGAGTEFCIYLPRLPDSEVTVEPPAAASTPRGRECILVVEDEDAVRELTAHLLTSLGYRVIQAASGSEAMARWDEYGSRVDAMVTDLVMPHMGGRELAAALQDRRPGLPVLFISGFVRDPDRHPAGAAGPILMKPFTRDELARALRNVLPPA